MITAQAVLYQQHGEPQEVLFTHSFKIDDENLKPDAVVVKTLASPVNPSDINQIQGVYPSKPPKTLDFGTEEPAAPCGNEGLFEVLKVGENVKDFQPGDWVIPSNVNFGTWRTHALGTVSNFIKLPNPAQTQQQNDPAKKGLTVSQAATISVNPPTAYLMLTHYVKLRSGKDWFVQNGGTSAVGKYASQIGKLLGINSISVVRDRDDLDETREKLKQLGATIVISEKENLSREVSADIKSRVKETQGEVKLALNCVGSKSSQGIAKKLNHNGLMLTYGGMSMQPVSIPTSLFIFKNIICAGFWVTELLKNNPELKKKTLAQIVEWYETGKLSDAPTNKIQFNEDAKEELHSLYLRGINDKNGKQLITYNIGVNE
ncbi:ETR1 [Candida oxycetoniae]|uniref:enoyl-[acyl-carrier-protein] reductase n=1 Tax=Candida oxycetoniae TaxID=497107 RepID=A0AAI9WVU0_9ASCO|nr:ETR1 [Candida oxycetoniae]KAI3402590.1 ETR1 [Candida oxycetoniae]